jgi:cytochrome c oxidase subunit 3
MRKKHLFHILPLSPWPILTAVSALFFVSGLAFYMHKVNYGGFFMLFGLMCVSTCAFQWFWDIIDEATFSGFTKPVRLGLRLGFMLFIASEIMLFFGFFWAFFHAALCPAAEIGGIFPPEGIHTIPVTGFPLFNTFVLIFSGFSVTWAHRAVSIGSYKEAIDSLLMTIFLGFFFVILQMFEYYEAPFNFADSVYGCSFYMLTGLHGCHVIVGACFLFVCFIRLLNRQYLTNHYLGFVFAIWYW